MVHVATSPLQTGVVQGLAGGEVHDGGGVPRGDLLLLLATDRHIEREACGQLDVGQTDDVRQVAHHVQLSHHVCAHNHTNNYNNNYNNNDISNCISVSY